jgi:hypothetical protein
MSSKAIHLFAKCLKIKSENKQNYYFINYYEWNKRHEWVLESMLLDTNQNNLIEKSLNEKMAKNEIKFEEKGIQVLNENFENKCLLNEKSFIFNKSCRKRTLNKRKFDIKLPQKKTKQKNISSTNQSIDRNVDQFFTKDMIIKSEDLLKTVKQPIIELTRIKTHLIDNQSFDKKTSNIGERDEPIVRQNDGFNEDSKQTQYKCLWNECLFVCETLDQIIIHLRSHSIHNIFECLFPFCQFSTNDYLIISNHCSQEHKEVKQIPINSKYYLKTIVKPEVEVKSFAKNVCEKIKEFLELI